MQSMISVRQNLTKSSHIYTNHSNTRRYTVVQRTRVMGFQKEVALPAVFIRVGFPKNESFHISLSEIGPDFICGVHEVPETEIC